MKLFLDDDSYSYKFNKSQCVSFDELCDRLDSLERDRSYVLRVNDGLLGHAYDARADRGPARSQG
ncbi:hypothetical protein [Burkholderia ubonensis]|uniref:hypothetical protein n=1 Tax=Burkholderia ubonensis TaxID=101571 RepID=UPI0034E933A1